MSTAHRNYAPDAAADAFEKLEPSEALKAALADANTKLPDERTMLAALTRESELRLSRATLARMDQVGWY